MTSNAYYTNALAVIQLLAERFPATFSVLSRRCRPLKVGVHLDLAAVLEGALSEIEIARGLNIYCSSWHYHKSCTEGATRIDLNGQPCGSVTAAEAAAAKALVTARRDKWKRRQAAAIQAKAKTEIKARNAGRISLAGLKAAAQARRGVAA